jgi:hypothetical protein
LTTHEPMKPPAPVTQINCFSPQLDDMVMLPK